ncbi:MAG: MarR family transcriptional regulator [Rhizobiaceae bacterium]|nr:MarR family transcriptional regulator [Rhizobiaceae bacterium]
MAETHHSNSILPMSQSFGHSLRHVNRLIQRDLGSRVSRLGITLGQWYALRTLWHTDGLTQIELAQKSGIAGPAMVIAVRSLLAMGLVSRRRPPDDKRKYIISLTEKGWQLEEETLRAAIEANREALAGIAEEDIDTCMRVLHAARDNLLNVGLTVETETEVDAMIE